MLNVYMKKNKVDVNLLSDTFHHVQTVLNTIMKSRNAQGVGIRNQTMPLLLLKRTFCGKRESLALKILTPYATLCFLWLDYIQITWWPGT